MRQFSKVKEGENFDHRNTLEYFEDYNLSLTQRLGKKVPFSDRLLGTFCMCRKVFFASRQHNIFKTPVADATGNLLNRWIEHNPGSTGARLRAIMTLPFLSVKPLTAKNMLTLNAHPNHFFGPLVFL